MDLCRLAGLKPAGVLCEIMNDDGTMARRPQLEAFAKRHNLKIGTIADLIRHRLRNERSVERISEQTVQTDLGEFRLYAYEDRVNQDVHLALARGRLDGPEAPLVRVHLTDTLRDLVGVQARARAWTLRSAMKRIAEAGNGVVVILRQQESPRDLTESVRWLRRRTVGDAVRACRQDRGRRGGAANLRRRRADPEGPWSPAHAGVVRAEADARHLRVRSRNRRLRWGRGLRWSLLPIVEGRVTAGPQGRRRSRALQ